MPILCMQMMLSTSMSQHLSLPSVCEYYRALQAGYVHYKTAWDTMETTGHYGELHAAMAWLWQDATTQNTF